MAVTLCVGMPPVTLCVTHRWSDAEYVSPSGTGFATPPLTFKVSKVIEASKRSSRGYKPRLASAVLEKFELIKDGRPTFGCHLLFSKNDVLLTTIEAGRFATQTVIKDSITSKESLIEQVTRIMDFIHKHTNKAYIITGNPRREERWDYPMDAIREIVINMIVHRDYRSANDSTIKIFDERIEFFNPGTLLEDLTVEKIKSGNYKSHLRNKQIASIFKELNLIEKYGSGVRMAIETFVAYGLPEPMYEVTQGGVAVTVFKVAFSKEKESFSKLKNEGVNEGVNSLLAIIKHYPGLRVPSLAEKVRPQAKILNAGSSNLKKLNTLNLEAPQKPEVIFHRLR